MDLDFFALQCDHVDPPQIWAIPASSVLDELLQLRHYQAFILCLLQSPLLVPSCIVC